MSIRTKLFIAVGVFGIGAVLSVIPALTKEHFEFLIPGILLLAVSAPVMYYLQAKQKSGYEHQSDEEIIKQATQESQPSKRSNDDKK